MGNNLLCTALRRMKDWDWDEIICNAVIWAFFIGFFGLVAYILVSFAFFV